jgi:hypothetical protein
MHSKEKPALIASAPTIEKLLEMAARYFCDKPERYDVAGDEEGVWFLTRDMKILPNYVIKKKQGRFRFCREGKNRAAE